MNDSLEAALWYGERGIPVFPVWWVENGVCACGRPCSSPAKHPMTAGGFKDATTHPATIRRWWGRYPRANIAGVCGAESGVVVLDVDPRHGGEESLAVLEREHGPLLPGPKVRTGGGGWHYYFRHPGGRVAPAVGLRPGLDLRADDSYALLPPSGHVSGGVYTWEVPLDGANLPLLPPWILKAATSRPARETTAPGEDGPIPEGQRNVALTSIAGSFRRLRASEETILTQLRQDNAARCQPPLPDHELEAIAQSVARYPKGEEVPETEEEEGKTGPAGLDETLDTNKEEFLDGRERFLPGAFAAHLQKRFNFATLPDTEEIRVYDLDRGVYVEAETRIKGWFQEVMKKSSSAHGANETLGHIQRATYVPRDAFNPDSLLCLQNGVLELNPLEVRPHEPEPRFTRQLPVVFDPGATCPEFLQFLEEILPDSELREIVQLLFGYCLKAGNWLQRAFLLWGGGNNGKSTLLRVLAALLGPDAVAARTLQALSSDKFAKASLYGKLANICPDLPAAPVAYTGAFKALTGQDPITGERKYQNSFTFLNEAVLIFSANQRPPVDDPTVAFWRRWVILPFEVNFEGQEDRHLLKRLTTPAEVSGVLNWALEGLRKLLELGDFPTMESSEARKEEWKRQSDSLYWFIQECVVRDPDSWVLKRDFFQAYAEFCEERDIQAKHPEAVGRELQRHIPRVRTYRPRSIKGRPPAWSGLSLRTTDGDDLVHLDHLDRPGVSGQGGQGGPYLLLLEEEVHEVLRLDPNAPPRFISPRVRKRLRESPSPGKPALEIPFETIHHVVREMHKARALERREAGRWSS